RCATPRTPCTTSPTTTGIARTVAARAASPMTSRARTNTGAPWGASTMSMATATWSAPVRRLRITQRPRSESSRCDQHLIVRVPTPEVLVGQSGPAPPAANWIVTSEIVGLSQDRITERRERQLAFHVSPVPRAIVVHLHRERSILDARHRRLPALSESIKQRALLPIAKDP